MYGKAVAGSEHVEEVKLSNTQASGSCHGDMSGTRVGACSIEGDHPSHGRGTSDGDDDSDKYAFPIVEEPTPDN